MGEAEDVEQPEHEHAAYEGVLANKVDTGEDDGQ